jgi:hypothetical protein
MWFQKFNNSASRRGEKQGCNFECELPPLEGQAPVVSGWALVPSLPKVFRLCTNFHFLFP